MIGDTSEAIKSLRAYKYGEKRFEDLEARAVYEAEFSLECSVTEPDDAKRDEDHEYTVEAAENFLNGKDMDIDSDCTHEWKITTYLLSDEVSDYISDLEDDDLNLQKHLLDAEDETDVKLDNFEKDLADGLIRKVSYRLDNDTSGKLYVETTRQLTKKEMKRMQKALSVYHSPEGCDLSEDFNEFLGRSQADSIFEGKFKVKEIPLETYREMEDYREKMTASGTDFVDAINSISADYADEQSL